MKKEKRKLYKICLKIHSEKCETKAVKRQIYSEKNSKEEKNLFIFTVPKFIKK